MVEAAYFAMLALILTHELDAMTRREWRLLPVWRNLSDETGRTVFVAAHVPLFFVLLVFGIGDPLTNAAWYLSAFAIIHVVMHWLLRNHPENRFNTVGSWVLIGGAGVFGALHILLLAV
ncbi:MAG: DUF6713 family protein [Pseudomonadota bacterium]